MESATAYSLTVDFYFPLQWSFGSGLLPNCRMPIKAILQCVAAMEELLPKPIQGRGGRRGVSQRCCLYSQLANQRIFRLSY